MSARVSVYIPDAGGPPCAVKVASDPEATERLRTEAQFLQANTHSGVVPFLDYLTTDSGAELHTRFVGPPLDRWHGTTEQIAGLVAALASTLADLHRAGTGHGRIDRSHVLLAADGRPVLCGFTGDLDEQHVQARDVHDLGQLLTDLLETSPAPRRTLRRLLEPAAPRRQLGLVAARASMEEAERRPTARAVARSILDVVPDAQLPEGQGGAPDGADRLHAVRGRPAPDPHRGPSDMSHDSAADSHCWIDADETSFSTAFVDLRGTDENEIFSDRPWTDTVLPGRLPSTDGVTTAGHDKGGYDDGDPTGVATCDKDGRDSSEPEDAVDNLDFHLTERTIGAAPTPSLATTVPAPWDGRRPGAHQQGTRRNRPREGAKPLDIGAQDRGTSRLRAQSRLGRRQLATAALALAAVIGITSGAIAATRGTSDGKPSDRATEAGPVIAPADDPDRASCPTTGGPDHPSTDPVATYQVDVTGDGCSEIVSLTGDGVVETAAGRWAVGEPDDVVTLGDWNCDGRATPAVYRPSTGAVFVFSGWAESDEPLSIEPIATLPDGRALLTDSPDRPGTSCDVPLVELADGTRRPVEIQP